MANIFVSAATSNVNVSTTASNIVVTDLDSNASVNVTTTISNVAVTNAVSNVVVSQGIGVSNAEVRAALSNVFPILYNVDNGVISIDEDAINIANAIVNGNITVKQFQETLYDHGNITTSMNVNITNGTIHTATLTSDLSNINISNMAVGGSATIILKQDAIGLRNLLTDNSSWDNWRFVNENKSIGLDPNIRTIINIVYDGTIYHAGIGVFDNALIENSALANSNIIINGQTFDLGSSGNITDFVSNITMQQNLTVAGTVTGQAITSNSTISANGIISTNTYINSPAYYIGSPSTSNDKQIVAYGAGGAESTAGILVYDANDANETGRDGVWKFNNDSVTGTYYKLPTSTTDLAEGTKLYFTAARARGNISVVDAGGLGSLTYNSGTGVFTYTGPDSASLRAEISATSPITYSNSTGVIGLSSTANIATTGNISGGYILGNGSFLTGVTSYGNANVANFLANGFGSNNISTTGNIIAGTATVGTLANNDFITTDYYWFKSVDKPIRLNANVSVGNPDGALIVNDTTYPYVDDSKITVKANNISIAVGYNAPGSFTVENIDANTPPLLQVISGYPVAPASGPGNGDVLTWGSLYIGTQSTNSPANIVLSRNGQINFDYANSDGIINGVKTIIADTVYTGNISTPAGTLNVSGNLNVIGNINYQNVTDLYVTDQKIVLNANAITNSNVEIIAYRPVNGDTESAKIIWNESELRWEFGRGEYDYGLTYFPIPTSTSNLAEGTNLYWTTDRGNDWLVTKTTSNLTEGTNLYYTTNRANTAIDTRVNKAFVEGLGISYTSLTDQPTIPTHTSNLVNDSGFITAATANVISVNGQTGVVVLDTDNISEGTTNLYYSNSRVNAFIQDNITTSDIDEGTNLYYTTDRANTWLATKTTSDLAEGTNLYYTTDRANSAIGAYQGAINTAGNITTSANVAGQYILGNGAFLTGITAGGGTYGDSNVTTLLANLGSNVISSTANISTTADINVSGNVYGNIVAEQINHPQPFGAILMNSIFVDELAIGRNSTNRIFISGYGGETVSQGQYLRITSTSPQTATFENFGLSFQNIGTFGGPGDPANISYSQTSSVTKAELRGDVGDITVNSVATGDTGWIIIKQDSTGGRTLTLGSAWKIEGCTTGNPVPIALGANEESLIFWTYDGTYYYSTVTPNLGSNVSVDIKTTGNIVSGNANITNAVNAATVNATGNVEGNYFIGNGSLLTGIASPYGDSNVTTLLADFGSNVISSSTQVNVGANLVANAAVVTVTNGDNISLDNERNLGLLIDRNNNSANVTVTTLSGINYRGSDNPDRIVFDAPLEGYTDGQPVTISGFTNATVAGALNGNVFYLRQLPFNPVRYVIFSDPEFNTGVNLGVTNINAGPGAVTYTRRNFVTPKEWTLNVDQLSNDLRIKEDGTTRVSVASGGNLNITGTANANSVVISQPGTAGTYANVIPIDSLAGVSPGSSTGFDSPSNVLVQIYESGQQFPIGNIYQLTLSDVTGPGNVNLNGQTFWSNGVDLSGYADVTQLFLDSAATIPANATVLGVTSQTVGGNVSFNFTPGTAGNNWQLSSVNGNLNIAHNGTTKVSVNNAGNINLATNATINYDAVYGCFHNMANITAAAANTVYAFEWPNVHINTNRVTVASNSRITIGQEGAYNFALEMQAENADNQDRTAYIWLAKNGTDIAETCVRVTLLKEWKQVIVKEWIVNGIAANDYIEVRFAVDNTSGIQLTSIPAQASPYSRPAVPAAVITVTPVGA